jgi:tetratricopeptide (TPR) repeat protein
VKALVIVALLAGLASADDASTAFHAAEVHATTRDGRAIGEFEAIGAGPLTRWSDDAYIEASRAAERAGDLARAIRDLQAALKITHDDVLATRARNDMARLENRTGEGAFAKVAAEHDRLVAKIQEPGDPKPALRELAALVEQNPTYPRKATAMLALAHGWETDGAFEKAHAWLQRAVTVAQQGEHERVWAELARFAIRAGQLDEAEAAIRELHDRELAADLRDSAARAKARHELRIGLWIALAVISLGVAWSLRRVSWKVIVRPSTEVVFMIPIAIVIALVAATGNPLVARAVRSILIVGVIVGWLFGAVFAASKPGRLRLAVQALCAIVAVIAASYLAIDHDRMIDLVVETWKSGPDGR